MANEKEIVKKDSSLGAIRIADEVVSIIAGLAAENVKQAIETMTGLSVVEVNVHVQGVGFPEETTKQDEVRVR